MKKQIISETKNYEQSTVDELLLDDTPKVNSFNFVTSDGVARAISGASGEVPVVTEGDNGKVLTAVYDAGGPAVEWATASSGGGDVTTADGYFRLGGSKPVKVQYTGSIEQIVTPESLDVDNHTKYTNSQGTANTNQICVWFDNTDGLKDLGAKYTATLKVKAASLLSGFPAGVRVNNVSPVYYCSASYMDTPSGPAMSGQLTITDNDIKEQTITVSGANQAGATSGYGVYLGFYIGIYNATDPDTGNYYDLTDALTALIANIEAGNVFELDWPNLTPGTDMLTTIPNLPSNEGQGGKFLTTVQTGPSTYDMQWAAIKQLPSSTSGNAGQVLTVSQYGAPGWAAPTNTLPTSAVGDVGKVLTVDAQGAPAWGMLGSVKSIQQVNALPASPDANTLYLIPEA